jgi:hypothetical protein
MAKRARLSSDSSSRISDAGLPVSNLPTEVIERLNRDMGALPRHKQESARQRASLALTSLAQNDHEALGPTCAQFFQRIPRAERISTDAWDIESMSLWPRDMWRFFAFLHYRQIHTLIQAPGMAVLFLESLPSSYLDTISNIWWVGEFDAATQRQEVFRLHLFQARRLMQLVLKLAHGRLAGWYVHDVRQRETCWVNISRVVDDPFLVVDTARGRFRLFYNTSMGGFISEGHDVKFLIFERWIRHREGLISQLEEMLREVPLFHIGIAFESIKDQNAEPVTLNTFKLDWNGEMLVVDNSGLGKGNSGFVSLALLDWAFLRSFRRRLIAWLMKRVCVKQIVTHVTDCIGPYTEHRYFASLQPQLKWH